MFKILNFIFSSNIAFLTLYLFAFIGCLFFWILSRLFNTLIGKKFFKFSLWEITKDIAQLEKRQLSFIFYSSYLNIKNKIKPENIEPVPFDDEKTKVKVLVGKNKFKEF